MRFGVVACSLYAPRSTLPVILVSFSPPQVGQAAAPAEMSHA